MKEFEQETDQDHDMYENVVSILQNDRRIGEKGEKDGLYKGS